MALTLFIFNVLKINNTAADLAILRHYLEQVDLSTLKERSITDFFVNKFICVEAKSIFLEKMITHFQLNTEDMSRHLDSIMIRNINEYEQLHALYNKKNIPFDLLFAPM